MLWILCINMILTVVKWMKFPVYESVSFVGIDGVEMVACALPCYCLVLVDAKLWTIVNRFYSVLRTGCTHFLPNHDCRDFDELYFYP